MIVRALVKLLGGFWKLKERCNHTQSTFLRRYLIGLYRAYQAPYGSSIAWNSDIEGMLCLPHGMHGIFIAATAKIGKNCVMFHQVTVGANILADSKTVGAPVIGNNCYIGAGAKIVGRVRVGNNVRIGANCVVYEDVPDNSVVVSSEQKTIRRDKPLNNKFHVYGNGVWRYFDDGRWIEETDPVVIEALAFCVKAYK